MRAGASGAREGERSAAVKRGRKPEGRVRMTVRVKPGTRKAIRDAKSKEENTDGKVIDERFK